MDAGGWWNTNQLLAPLGAQALSPGFPRTHLFAQARIVFEVARRRCEEPHYRRPGSLTLWNLPPEPAARFDEQWPQWVEDVDTWRPFFDQLAGCQGADLCASLQQFGLLSDELAQIAAALPLETGGWVVHVPTAGLSLDDQMTLLAAAFGRGGPRQLVVPYATGEAAGV